MLGGSLPESTWGNSDMAYPTFEWIATHPWIKPLTVWNYLTFPAKAEQVVFAASASTLLGLKELRSAPENAATQSAWQMYLTLTSFTADTHLRALRSAYLGQVGEILAAANWAKKPTPRIDCKDDLNGDGHAECILTNQRSSLFLSLPGPG